MSPGDSVAASQAGESRSFPRGYLLLWVVWGAVILGTLNFAAVRRTQEARVLETAREMLGSGVDGWIIPYLNGEVRLHKPPLAYWLSAIAFKIFGVGEWAGRLPGALAGWLTVGVTFSAAKWLFNARAAFFAAASLAGSTLFCRHMQLAETDGMTALFVTVAVVCFWRASGVAFSSTGVPPVNLSKEHRRDACATNSSLFWHLASAAVGLAAMSKGPPALFSVLFLIALAGISRRWGILWRWARSGAPVTLAAIAIPWWIAAMTIGSRVMGKELHDVLGGQDHPAWFYVYFPFLLTAVAPWSLLVPVSVVFAGTQWRVDPRLKGLLIWILAIFLPLCFTGNKQSHYLLPMLPPLMILVGWFMDKGLRGSDRRWAGIATLCFGITWVGCIVAAAAMVVVPSVLLHHIRAGDILLATAILLAAGTVQILYRRRNSGEEFGVFAASCAILMAVVIGVWSPSLNISNSRDIAAALRTQFGLRPYRFYGDGAYLPLCFAMRQEIPYVTSPSELRQARIESPNVVILVQADPKARSGKPLPEFPVGLLKVTSVGDKDEQIDVYEFSGSKTQE